MDLVITNGTVVTMNAAREVLVGADVVVEDGRIAHVGAARASRPSGRRVIDARGKVVLPGLIHGHLHACQTLFRNHADGLELLDWLRERIWPFEAAHDAASMRASARLTFAELIRSGATGALDMGTVHHYDEVFEAARACGFRLTGGKAMMDAGDGVPARLRETTAESLDESLRLAQAWHGQANGRLRYAFAPRFALSCSPELMRKVGELARARGLRVHSHASENPTETELVKKLTGKSNVELFHALGLTGDHVTLAHCVWLSEVEEQLLASSGTIVAHCPSSNLKLASGIARIPELLSRGIQVSLGADGAPCNNNLDLFLEMRLAALLPKPRLGPTAMPARTVVELATLGGAAAIGASAEVGSLEVGKRADVIVVDLSAPHAQPAGDDIYNQLVYSANARDVVHVLIDGEAVMRDRRLITLDVDEVVASARIEGEKLLQRCRRGAA